MTIVIATTEERFWRAGTRRIVITRTGPQGQYRVRNLPPGSYVVAVADQIENGRQYDPAFLHALRADGRWVTLADGGTVRHDLRVR